MKNIFFDYNDESLIQSRNSIEIDWMNNPSINVLINDTWFWSIFNSFNPSSNLLLLFKTILFLKRINLFLLEIFFIFILKRDVN
jgi:hypothetical protein